MNPPASYGAVCVVASGVPRAGCRPIRNSEVPTVSIPASSLALGAADYSWRRDAVCRDTDPELFFPVGTTGQALLQIDQAKRVCGECPVQADCLQYALDTNQDAGIWGGTSEDERRSLRRTLKLRQRVAV